MSRTRRLREPDPAVQELWTSRTRIGVGVGAVGTALVIVAIVLGNGYRGLSLATGIHLLGMLALGTMCVMAAGPMWRFAKADGRGRPIMGLGALVVLVSAGWLVVRARTELAAGAVWTELQNAVASDDAGAAQVLIRRFPDVPDPELRVKFVKRMGELGDERAAVFLREAMLGHPESAVRDQAAVSYGKVATGARVDTLVEMLDSAEGADRQRVLTALRTTAGENHGTSQADWLGWRLGNLLDEGTPDAIESLLVRMGRLDSDQTDLYKRLRGRLSDLDDVELRPLFEKILRASLKGRYRLDRKALAAEVLGNIGSEHSIEDLKRAIERVRRMRDEKELHPGDAERFWDVAGKALRRIAGKDVLDEERFIPVWTYFVALLHDEDEVVRNFAADHLEALSGERHGLDIGKWGGWFEDRTVEALVAAGDVGELTRALRRQAKASDLERSAQAMDALVKLGDPEGLAAIRSMALRKGAEIRMRSMAVDKLAGAGKGMSKKDLLELLRDEDDVPMLRSVVAALARFDEGPVVELLHERYLIEEDVDLRREILNTVRRMTDDRVFAVLVDAVRDEAPAIFRAAVEELEKRSGQNYGDDPERWEDWFRRTFD